MIDTVLPCTGEKLEDSWALQDPADWLEVLATAVPAAVQAAGIDPAAIVGIATAFTASTPLPVLRDGTPLCRLAEFERRPHAYPKLWKHHAAQEQADRITAVAAARREPWLARYGGRISSEWEFAKALQVLEEAPDIYAATDRWIEAADWIVWQLCGAETRNACTAGYKGIFQDGRYPSRGLPRRAPRRVRRLRRGEARAPAGAARRPRREPDRAGGVLDGPDRRGSRSPWATSTRTSRRRLRGRSSPATCWR